MLVGAPDGAELAGVSLAVVRRGAVWDDCELAAINQQLADVVECSGVGGAASRGSANGWAAGPTAAVDQAGAFVTDDDVRLWRGLLGRVHGLAAVALRAGDSVPAIGAKPCRIILALRSGVGLLARLLPVLIARRIILRREEETWVGVGPDSVSSVFVTGSSATSVDGGAGATGGC